MQSKNSDVADVIVVGAGAAGSVIAARLSEDPERDVLLLETGTSVDGGEPVPALGVFAMVPDRLHSNITVPQPGLAGRVVDIPTGKGLGGGSSVNLLAWFQGAPEDYAG